MDRVRNEPYNPSNGIIHLRRSVVPGAYLGSLVTLGSPEKVTGCAGRRISRHKAPVRSGRLVVSGYHRQLPVQGLISGILADGLD